jgi:hypothetical protein
MVTQVTPHIGNIAAASGRAIKEDDTIVNIADILTGTGPWGPIPVTIDGGSTSSQGAINSSSGKTLFHADFSTGIDTLNTWNFIFAEEAITDSLFSSADNSPGLTSIGPADPTKSSVPIFIEGNLPFSDRFILESKNYIKLLQSCTTFIYISGVFSDIAANVLYPTTMAFGFMDNSVETLVQQADWNFDKMDGTGPSELTLDFSKLQTLCINVTQRDTGAIIFGFVVNNIFYPAHIYSATNSASEIDFSTAHLPLRTDASADETNIYYRYGFFNRIFGFYLQATTNVEEDPTYAAQTSLMDCSVVAYGGVYGNFNRKFSAGNDSLISVTTEVPIMSIRASENLGTEINRTVFTIDSIEVSANASDLTNGALIKLLYNGNLSGDSFTSVDANSGVHVDTSASANMGGTLLHSFYIFPNSCKKISFKEEIENFMNRFSLLNVDGNTYGYSMITITAQALNDGVDIGARINWNEVQ